MSRTRLLTIMVAGLMLLNIALMVFLVLGKPAPPMRERRQPKDIIIKKLQLDPAQIESYDTLIQQHRRQINQKQREINHTRRALYESLQTGDRTTQDSLIDHIGKLQSEIEKTHMNHFRALKQLCHADQQSRFNELTHELAQIFGPPPPPRR